MSASANTPSPLPRRTARWLGPVGFGLVLLVVFVVLTSRGLGIDSSQISTTSASVVGTTSALLNVLIGLFAPLLYVLAALGLGRPFAAVLWTDTSSCKHAVQLIVGLALMLTLSHLMGMAGVLSGNSWHVHALAYSPIFLGLVFLVDQLIRGSLRPETWPNISCWLILSAPALGVAFAAAASPPGWLWESEFGGYDVLSYHLQLPKEWATPAPEGLGGIVPTDHNVYSFLPSYFESAFLHLGAMTPAVPSLGTGIGLSTAERLVGGDGVWIHSCQLLHVLMLPVLGLILGSTIRSITSTPSSSFFSSQSRNAGAWIGAAVALATPWTVVAGSMAYNDIAMLAFLAGAILVSIEPTRKNEQGGRTPQAFQRGLLAGLLVGCACSVKPTALLMGAPLVALMLAATVPARTWLPLALGGVIGGMSILLPWLIRNAAAAGNPVFPFAADFLGHGHWTTQQLATYAAKHISHEPWIDRFGWLFSDSRGLLHAQWAMTPLTGLFGALIWAFSRKDTPRRLLTAVALGAVVQIISWMSFSHLQSRFLLPLLVPISLCVGVGSTHLIEIVRTRSGSKLSMIVLHLALALVPIATGLWTYSIFSHQRLGNPNALLLSGVSGMTGTTAMEFLAGASNQERENYFHQRATPEGLINLAIRPALSGDGADLLSIRPTSSSLGRVFLLGDATAFYLLDATGGPLSPVVYHTTWDRSPVGDAIEFGGVNNISPYFHQLGIEFVLVNFAELHRLIEVDHYYDQRVRIDDLRDWLRGPDVRLIRTWPMQERALYQIVPSSPNLPRISP